jgi:SNF2 family DNA or RNA helicase
MTGTKTTETLAFADIGTDGRIWINSDYRVKDQIKAVPGARWSTDDKVWTVPLAWTSCLALRAQLGPALRLGDDLRKWAFSTREVKNRLTELHTAVTPASTPDLPGFGPLYPYQVTGAEAVAAAGGYGLFDEQGAGKSRTSLAGVALAAERGAEIFPMLIVAPKSMLSTWARDEIPHFFPKAGISVVSGTPTKIRAALAAEADIYVISYGTLRLYSRHAPYPTVKLTDAQKVDKELNAIAWKTVVADEAHRVKNPASQQTRALWHVSKDADWRLALTGSPIQENAEDLWSVLRYIAPHEYPTKTGFVERFLDVSYNHWGGREVNGLNPSRADEFRANLDTRYRRVTKAIALPFLPPKVYETRWVELPTKARKAYNDMVTKMVADLETGSTLVADSPLTRAGRLTQMANASGTVDADGKFHMELPSPKIEAFIEDVNNGDFEGQSVVVYSASKQLLYLLADELKRQKKPVEFAILTGDTPAHERTDAIDAFQAGQVPFILLTKAGGEGITLTAASVMVRLTRSWSKIDHDQAEDRVHRIGSEIHDSILYIDYLTEDTIEEGQVARLNSKTARAQEVLRDDELLAMLKPKSK